jgi:hypothetical protein
MGKVDKVEIVNGDDHSAGTKGGRDKVGGVQQIQAVGQQLQSQGPPLKTVMAGGQSIDTAL